jgi:hypothetical protein
MRLSFITHPLSALRVLRAFVVVQNVSQYWQRVSELPAIGRALTGVEKSHGNNDE